MEPLQMNEKTVPELPHGWVWMEVGRYSKDLNNLQGIISKEIV